MYWYLPQESIMNTSLRLRINMQTKVKVDRNHQKHMNQKVRQACLEMEAEIAAKLPEDAFFNIFHVSNQLEKKGYKLARQYNTSVCNGITFLVVQTPTQACVFSVVCSKQDTYSRLDGRKEVLTRAYQTIVKEADYPATAVVHQNKEYLLREGQEPSEKAFNRAAINHFIENFINTKVKKPVKFEVTRQQVLNAEAALVELLKKSNPNSLDYRLIYSHKDGYRAPKSLKDYNDTANEALELNSTTLKVVVAKSEHNAKFDQSVIDEFEKQAGALTVTVNRYRYDSNNRLAARWYAVRKLAKKLKQS